MKKLKILVSLVSNENEYQREQSRVANDAAQRLGVDLQVIYADGDAINQGQQILEAIQAPPTLRPDAVICHPAGTGLIQVAQAAISAGVGWAIVNREVDYLATLRASSKLPSFCISADQREIGRIQSRQMVAFLPQGGLVLYIQGPTGNFSADERTHGMQTTKPANLQVRMIRGRFTEESGYQAVKQWLTLSTSRQTPLDMVCSQNDAMALGARRALEEEKALPHGLVFTGCDAAGEIGQDRVRKGILAASIVLPPTAGLAVESFVNAFQTGMQPPEQTILKPTSFPPVDQLATRDEPAMKARV
jgi:ABC-type sugar transport system substrate-binding protein